MIWWSYCHLGNSLISEQIMRRYRYLSLQMVLLLMLVRAFAAEEAMIKKAHNERMAGVLLKLDDAQTPIHTELHRIFWAVQFQRFST